MSEIIVVAHNLRSTHNVGALLRTADGLGVHQVVLSGYTPYPRHAADDRLPHLAAKIHRQIVKTALGAEISQAWRKVDDLLPALQIWRASGYTIAALEQTEQSLNLTTYAPPAKLVLILGREVEGLEPEVINACDVTLEIPMFGQKESYNVVQAAAMALYHCRFGAIGRDML